MPPLERPSLSHIVALAVVYSFINKGYDVLRGPLLRGVFWKMTMLFLCLLSSQWRGQTIIQMVHLIKYVD